MLSRRLIRVKVMQALYAFFQNEDNDLPRAEKQLLINIERIYELYIWQLSFFVELVSYFEQRADEAKQKFLPSEADLNPNTRFIDNKLLKQLAANLDFNRQSERFRVNWGDQREMFRSFYNDIRTNEEYLAYIQAEKCNYEDDRSFIIKLIRSQVFPSTLLQNFFEEKNIHWADDFDTALLMVLKLFKTFTAKQEPLMPLPGLYQDDETEAEDTSFARELLRKTIIYSKEYSDFISKRAQNWEIERIAMLDIILIKMAIAELLQFPTIPIKVTLNEYIEISKQYSTPKSRLFINGLLDKLIMELKAEGKIRKTGRGLIDD